VVTLCPLRLIQKEQKLTEITQRCLSRNQRATIHAPHTKHHELHFVLVWFRVDLCDFADRLVTQRTAVRYGLYF